MTPQIVSLAAMGLAAPVLALGLALVFAGVLALLRFPDFFTRAHAFGAIAGWGAGLVLASLAIGALDGAIALRLLVLASTIAAAGPAIAHATASAAHAGGLAPLTGAYRAPRPGGRRGGEP